MMFNNTVLRTHAPFRYLTFLLDVGIELTANQCQSVSPSVVYESSSKTPTIYVLVRFSDSTVDDK